MQEYTFIKLLIKNFNFIKKNTLIKFIKSKLINHLIRQILVLF
jgi:hypothetical protein